MAVRKGEKTFRFCDLFKFTVVKTDAKFQTKFLKGIPFVIKGIRKRYLVCQKWYNRKG